MLASVLKPVDDTRMFEKIGVTLAGSEAEVTIIGYPVSPLPSHKGIEFHSLPTFKRISWKRFLMPWLIFKKINQAKPELIIINTPELLFVAILSRIFFGRKIIYDVRENYYRNIRFTNTFPTLVRLPLAVLIRFIELISWPFIHRYILAEKGYQDELNFARPHIILENKLPMFIAQKYPLPGMRGFSKLIFNGTLASSTGVFEAIQLCKALHRMDPSYSLTIIGYCGIPEVLIKIKNEISDSPFITLMGGDTLVPHHQVLQEINQADMGIVIYPPNPSTQSSIPTKLFEYLALKLPVLIRHNPESHQLVAACNAGIILEETPHYKALSEILKSKRFAPSPPDSIYWESQSEALINSLK